ncbi:MAG: addiction module protein [Spirochaetales bacterium]|nr:addiction module protein [Spirochaetales bacterium]
MQNTIEIKHLTTEEKLRVMEDIWEDLSIDEGQIKSPEWHNAVLKETNNRFSSGLEKSMDWHDAKKELQKRFE